MNIDSNQFLEQHEEQTDGPLIQMIVSLGFPGMGSGAAQIQAETTRLAFDAVRYAGGRPRLVQYTTGLPLRPIAEVLDEADGLIFLGGADVDPECYGYAGPPLASSRLRYPSSS